MKIAVSFFDSFRSAYDEFDRWFARKCDEEAYICRSDDGKILGKVDDIYNTGANDIYVVKDELGKQVLLPAISDVIKNIDIKNKKVTVHIVPGLM